jgi:enamine deaminase RidA (YjgF/YER057c/UK114 family)
MTVLKHLLPADMAAPFAAYSHGVKVGAGAELVFCSGQLGIAPDGSVRINAYVTDRAYMRPYMDVRDRLFPQPAPASTLMIVSGFTREEFKVEIEVVAAKA